MKREHIEQMLSQIDKSYIKEAIDAGSKKDSRKRNTRIEKWIAAAAVCAIVFGTGITVTATASDAFRGWLTGLFGRQEITKVDIEPQQTPVENAAADLPADKNNYLLLEENMEIYGETESFVCQYHMLTNDSGAEKMVVDKLYSIQNDGLKKMELQNFHGTYEGKAFSFEYAIINNEIYGCNLNGNINQVFHYTDSETAYVSLCELTEDIFTKMCIAKVNLKTGEVEKLTNDTTIGNMMLSPNGKMVLINYRTHGYWAAFDIANRTEKRIKGINGYAHTHEVIFQDDYHILTNGDSYKEGDAVINGTKIIDLRTGKRTASYKNCGDPYNPQWVYEQEGSRLTIQHVDGTVSIQIDEVDNSTHPLSYRGNFVLLGNPQNKKSPYYLCDLKGKKYMKIEAPSTLEKDIKIYLAAKEEKILLTDGKDAYLVDIHNLG